MVEVSSDMIAIAGSDTSIKIWQWKKLEIYQVLIGHSSPVQSLGLLVEG